MNGTIYLRPAQEGSYKFLFTSPLGHLSGEVVLEGAEEPDTRSRAEKEDAARHLIGTLAQNFISAARDQFAT